MVIYVDKHVGGKLVIKLRYSSSNNNNN
jgi:hypothetical protein